MCSGRCTSREVPTRSGLTLIKMEKADVRFLMEVLESILGSNYIETKAPWQEVGLKFCEH